MTVREHTEIALIDSDLVALCDAEDEQLLRQYRWRPWLGKGRRTYYARSVNTKIQMHRLILPHIRRIDHANGNGLDNRRSNLRPATASQNAANSKARDRNKLGVKGVNLQPNCPSRPYRAQIMCQGKKIHLGSFATVEEALSAYQSKAKELFGEYANG